jgi:ankyrin repeat protein
MGFMLRLIKSKVAPDRLYNDLVKELHKDNFDEKKVLLLLKDKNINIHQTDSKGRTFIFDLVKKRKLTSIQFLLRCGFNIKIEDRYGKTVLDEAIGNNDGIMIRFLLEHGFDINHVNSSNRTVLQDVALEGNEKVFELLMTRNPNVQHKDMYLKNVLYDAIEGSNITIIEQIVHEFEPEDLNEQDQEGKTVLFYAVLKPNPLIAQLLIKNGIDVNICDNKGQNALFNAVVLGAHNLETIELMIKKGLNLNLEDKSGLTILDEILTLISYVKNPVEDTKNKYRLVSSDNNYLKLASVLMEYDLPLNKPNEKGQTVLYKEVAQKNYDAIDFLLQAGADINIPDLDGRTVLFDAILDGTSNIKMTEYLIKQGANIDHEDKQGHTIVDELVEIILIQQNGKKPTHRRYYDIKPKQDYFDLLKKILGYKPRLDRVDKENRNIIFKLVQWGNLELLKIFINFNCDINHKDKYGNTPLSFLVQEGIKLKASKQRENFLEVLSFLLKYRTDVNLVDDNGRTILQKAIIADDLEVVEKLMLSKKADITIKDNQGRTALHHTQWKGNTKIARLLIANGARINEPDASGYTLLNYAAILGHIKLIQVLIAHGVLMYNHNKKSKAVTQFFLKNESNLDKLLQIEISDEKMKKGVEEVVYNLKNEIRQV